MKQLELQQSLQRFASRFTDRIGQALEALDRSQAPLRREQVLRRALSYGSSVLEIATGPTPALNLLDMFVFVRLCRDVLERHWMRELGEEGLELEDAFARSDDQITELANQALGRDAVDQLATLVDEWLLENPHQTRVEGIRLADFAETAGAAVDARSREVRGLLASVKSTATDALQLAERMLFLVHRLPSMWRMQVRLALHEVVSDVFHVVRKPMSRLTQLVRRPFHLRA